MTKSGMASLAFSLALTGMSSCWYHPQPTCGCQEFPVPPTCTCFVADAQIESVNKAAGTATVKLVQNGKTTSQTVLLAKLPKDLTPEVGAKFTALLRPGTTPEKP